MEEDIKILEEQLNIYKRHLENYEKEECLTSVYYELKKYAQALENLLTRYKQLEEENKELREEECCMTTCLRKDKERVFLENKIKEKKKEKEESFKKTCELHDCDTKFETLNKLQYEIDLCGELLEEE